MEAAFSRSYIINPDELFGRNELLDKLVMLANNKYCVSITGLRRFGKTSVLKCLEYKLRSDSISKVYPVYYDFKEVGALIKGTDNAYKYMIAVLISSLTKDNLFSGIEKFGKIEIQSSIDWKDIFEQLEGVNSVRIQSLLEDIINLFSDLIEKTILFLIDEYEWLFKYTFDTPVGFMKLRSMASSIQQNGRNPFSFWIIGALSWDYLCTLTGSGELNVIDAPPVYIGPIDFSSFKNMWEQETQKIENCNDDLKNLIEFAFKSSGGIPFYGKLIGSYFWSNNKKPDYLILDSHLKEMISSLQTEEIRILTDCSISPRNYHNNRFVIDLIEKGLIKQNGRSFELKSDFIKTFFISKHKESKLTNITTIESIEITDKISELIRVINNNHFNKKSKYIFEPVNDDAALLKDLRTPCYSLELFSDFASSIYKILFERTKECLRGIDTTKARLPISFKRNNQFIEIVDILRHSLGGGHIMDTFNQRPGQMSKSKMLHILTGNKNDPNSPEEFYNLQISILKMFEQELIKLNSIVKAIT